MSSRRRRAMASQVSASVIRWIAAKARFSEPNRSMIAVRAGELGRVGQAAQRGDDLHQRLKGLPGLLQPQLGDPAAGEDFPAPEAVGEELLTPRLVLEQVERADPRRDRLRLQLRFEVRLQLGLLEEFLERAPARQHAVAELDRILAPARPSALAPRPPAPAGTDPRPD